jgi:predicted Zn finger-like uncharacterized protein
MKIACQSCQAKYTIADEKVVGKIVKIRCKKCSSTIVINGNEGGASSGAGAGAAESGDQWTVNVADDDQRTMSSAEVAEAYQAGVVRDDTYCWSDGMPDWLPLREIPQLYGPCIGAGGAEIAPASVQGAPGGVSAASVESTNGHSSSGAHTGISGAVARRVGGRGSGADLFSGAAHAGSEDDVMTSAPVGVPQVHGAAAGEDTKLTGQRNENSVLFSLGALTGGNNGPAKPAMPATSEASGLLDIRQLGASIALQPEKKASSRVDDIMNLGGGGAFTAALAAPPVLAPPPPMEEVADAAEGGETSGRKGKGLLLAVIGGGVVVAAAAAVMFIMKPKPATDVDVAASTSATATTAETQATAAAAPSATTTSEPSSTTATAQANAPASAPAAEKPAEHTEHTAEHKDKPKSGGTVAAATPASNTAASKPTAEEPKPAPPPPAAAVPLIGDQPFNMGEAKAKLGTVASSLGGCKKPDGPTGSGKVVVTFAPAGNVQSAVVGAPFGGTPTGSCVQSRFSSVRVPPFTGSPFSVTKSFVLN